MANPSSIFLMLGASFCFACAAILTKSLGTNVFGEGVHPLQIAHARFLFSFILLVSFWYIFKPKVKFSNVKLHLLRSIFGWLGVSILFTSILYIPVSDATALTFLNPIFAMIFAVLIFKEKVGLIRWGAALISFSGGLLLLRPSLDLSVDPVALLCLFGALIMGLEIICIKILSGRDSVFTILILNNFFAMCIGTLVVPFFFVLPGFLELSILVTIGIFMLTGQFCFINSLKGAETSFLMPFFYTTLIFVISLDLIIFNSLPDKISYIGAFIIIFGSIIVAFREWRVKLKLSVKKIL
jgi:drug/metabolite transporter (DMT)-like permease|tara:strand:+ start:409 stop:1299 length:891 start_codon:yes stop_codon:yes gene_type:complete